MKIARVIGNLVSTIKTPSHENRKILWVQWLTHTGEPIGTPFIALDAAQAGIGDVVLIIQEGGSIRSIMDRPDGAVDALAIGVIDHVTVDGERRTLMPADDRQVDPSGAMK